MEGVIVNFRRGKHVQHHDQMVVKVEGVDTKDKAKGLVGKKVVWASPAKKELHGEIKQPHGNKGALRVHFETGMPGQCVGTKVKIV
jgi:large subunit ribosomal protein L35Ae